MIVIKIFLLNQGILYAMRNIVSRNSLKTAINNSQNKYSISTIKSAYAKFQIFDENLEPTRDQKNWLKIF
jgi:hypothetical protein